MRSGRFLPPPLRGIGRLIHGLKVVEGPAMGGGLGGVPLTGRPADKALILNQAWRRADWRFLTLHPWPQRSLCFGDDLLARSLALISGSLAVNRPAPEGSCDLAAIQNPSDGTLFMAMQSLAPSGTLYAEFETSSLSVIGRSRGPGRIARARQMLEAAGFVDVQFYFAYPNFETTHLWLPHDLPDAPCRYLAERWSSRPFLKGLAGQLLAKAVRLELLPGLCAIARKDSGRSGTGGHGNILDLGREDFDHQTRAGAGTYPFLLQSSSAQNGGAQNGSGLITGLVFALPASMRDTEPQWVMKMARVHEDEAALRNEQQVLDRLERVTSGDSSPVRLPRVLFLKDTNPGVVLCQTAIRGQSLSQVLRTASAGANFSLYAERLTNLQISLARRTLASRTLATSPLGLSQSKIDRVVNELSGCLPESVLRPAEVARLRQVFSTLVNLPIVCAHNNFAPCNVVIDGSRLGLLDWTAAEWSGLPMLDLVYMLAQMTFILHGARSLEQAAAAYRAMLDPLTRPGQTAQECLFRYTHSLGLPSGHIPALRLLTWALQASFEYRRLHRQFQGQVPASCLAQSKTLALLRVELEEQVLPAWEEDEED